MSSWLSCAVAATGEASNPDFLSRIRQIDRASAWWRKNRHKAPDAFDRDVDEALELIRDRPDIGQLVRSVPGMRRLWLERIRYYIYYSVRNDIVDVVAVWHASRRQPRRL